MIIKRDAHIRGVDENVYFRPNKSHAERNFTQIMQQAAAVISNAKRRTVGKIFDPLVRKQLIKIPHKIMAEMRRRRTHGPQCLLRVDHAGN